MIVTAMLAWYDEDPAILHRAVTSLACIADRLVATDGRWNHYPGTEQASPSEQYDAIRTAAFDAGLQVELESRHAARTWTGQVAKRNHLLHLAQPTDWLLPLDADWELHGDRTKIRHELQATQADALRVPFHTPPNHDAALQDVAATNWHAQLAGTIVRESLLWRNLPQIRIDDYHWQYSALKDGHRVALWGDHHPQAATADLQAPMRIDHHCLHRDQRTIQANRTYCARRDKYASVHGREP